MKATTLFFSLAVLLLLACKSETGTDHSNQPEAEAREMNTISQATYDNWTGAWKEVGAAYTDTLLTEYFTMPNVDLQEFALHGHRAARFVLGMDTTGTELTPHLMLVGVDSSGKSMIPANGFPNASIYDVTRPCPKYCGSASLDKLTK